MSTAEEMFSHVETEFDQCDVLVMSAAVADAKPLQVSESKIKKFAETHFNYTDSKLGIKPLTDFTKEYYKVKDKKLSNKQLDVMNKLSNFIRDKRAYLN